LNNSNTLIVTAASESYSESLFALIGSIYANWENHPPIVVYDIGLSKKSLSFLINNHIEVKKVIPFCDHWRDHYTWKLWCLNDANSENIIWIDAGLCVLDNLDDIISEININGYFVVPNFQFLDWEASEMSCLGCDLEYTFRISKPSIGAGLMGFKKVGLFNEIIKNALEIGKIEKYIKQYDKKNRYEQAILSLLLYKNIDGLKLNDAGVYLGWKSPYMVKGQKIWVHRRSLNKNNYKEFIKRLEKKKFGRYFPSKNFSFKLYLKKLYLKIFKIYHI
jgi:hypothetical protein